MLHRKKNRKNKTLSEPHGTNQDEETNVLRQKLKKFIKQKEQTKTHFRFQDNLPQKISIPKVSKPTNGLACNRKPKNKAKHELGDLESTEESLLNDESFVADSTAKVLDFKSRKTSSQRVQKPVHREDVLKNESIKKHSTYKNSKYDMTGDDSDSSECPELIPIDNECGNYGYDDKSDSESFSIDFDEENSEDDISVYDSDDYTECFEEASVQADVLVSSDEIPIINPLRLDGGELNQNEDDKDGLYKRIQLKANSDIKIISAMVKEISTLPSPQTAIAHKEDALIPPMQNPSQNVFVKCMVTDAVLALVKEPFYIYGSLAAKLVGGQTNVLGFDFEKGKFFEIFSLRGYGEMQMAPVPTNNVDKVEVIKAINNLNLYFLPRDVDAMLEKYDECSDAIVLLYGSTGPRSLPQGFQCEMAENIFPKTYCMQSDPSMFVMRQCVLRNYSDSPIIIPHEWQLLKLEATSKVMIVGGKGVGKSTLVRYLVNSTLGNFLKVLVIDLDIGQSEIFLPQTVSCKLLYRPILGPGYFFNPQPDKAFAIGKTNILLCDELYFDSVEQLMKFCHNEPMYKDVPWVVNTMGYNKGFGTELIGLLCKYVQPTDIIQLQSKRAVNNFDEILYPLVLRNEAPIITADRAADIEIPNYNLHLIHTAVTQENSYKRKWQMSATDKRYANIITHLSYLAGDRGYIGLLDARSEKFPRTNFKLLNLLHGPLHSDANYKVEIGLVMLCNNNESSKVFECFGIGILRGLDEEFVEIVHKIPSSRLPLVNCGIFGEMVLPKGIYLYQLENYRQKMFVHSKSFGNKTKGVRQIYRRPKKFLLGNHKAQEN